MNTSDLFSNLKKGKETKETKETEEVSNDLKKLKEEKPKDDAKEKMKLIYSIQHYGKNKRFGDYLKNECNHNFDENYLRKLSIEELKLELEKQNAAIGNKNNSSMIDVGFEKFLTFLEGVIHNRSKYKIAGTTQQLFGDDHFLDLLEVLKLKYNIPFIRLDPAIEIALIIIQTAFMKHQMNSVMDAFTTSTNLDEEL